jgi:hypothetical protein
MSDERAGPAPGDPPNELMTQVAAVIYASPLNISMEEAVRRARLIWDEVVAASTPATAAHEIQSGGPGDFG